MAGKGADKSSGGAESVAVTVRLNARLSPEARGVLYEEPLEEVLKQQKLGELEGAGSHLSEDGEIEAVDIDMLISGELAVAIPVIVETLEGQAAPKGSTLSIEGDDEEIELGIAEGLALYLNGTDLADEVYENNDPNELCEEVNRVLGDDGALFDVWEGPSETALYIYGESFEQLNQRLADLVSKHPLCQKARIVQIA